MQELQSQLGKSLSLQLLNDGSMWELSKRQGNPLAESAVASSAHCRWVENVPNPAQVRKPWTTFRDAAMGGPAGRPTLAPLLSPDTV
jgi:hypothetical protein